MSKFLIIVLALGVSSGVMAETKKVCGKYTAISCSDVDGAKRSHFCWKKGEPSAEKKNRICMKERRKKRAHKFQSTKSTKS